LLSDFDGEQAFPKYSPDGQTILFKSSSTLFTVEALGGIPRPIATRQCGENPAFFNPYWSPDGEQIAFTARIRMTDGTGMDSLYVLDLSTRRRSVVAVIQDVHSPAWSPDGSYLASFLSTTII